MTTSETAQDAMMESVHRPMPALAPKLFWFLVAVAVGATLLLAAPPSPAQETTPETAPATPTITLSVNQTSVTEGSSNISISVTATASEAVSYPTTVMVEIGRNDDSATRGTDYAYVAPFHIIIASGGMTGTSSFNLASTDDNVAGEGSETITVFGTSFGLTVISASIALADADTAVTLSVDTSRAAESSGNIPVTVKATVAMALSSNLNITVSVGSSGDTATSGTDYKRIGDINLMLLEGEKEIETRFNLVDTDDNIAGEGYEYITISGSTEASDFIVSNISFTLTDADSMPSVTLAVDTNSDISGLQHKIEEGDGEVTVTIKASIPANSVVLAYDYVVRFTGGRAGDTASPGADYRWTAGYVTLEAGSTSSDASFKLNIIDDNYAGEDDETFTLSGNATYNGVIFPIYNTTLTIEDNDEKPTTINLSVTGNGVEGESKKITVTGSFPAGSAVLVSNTSVSITFAGTADSRGDFITILPKTLNIASGQSSSSVSFNLTAKEDTVVEGAETINVTGTATDFSINGSKITILDNDLVLSIDTDTNTAGNQNTIDEDSGTATVMITAKFLGSGTLAKSTAVSITVGKDSDSATKGSTKDYTITSSSSAITIPVGSSQISTTFIFSINNDTEHEKDETITIVGGATGFVIGDVEMNIRDNDIGLSISPESTYEFAQNVEFEVTAELPYGTAPAGGITIGVVIGKSSDSATTNYYKVVGDDFTLTIPHTKAKASIRFRLNLTEDDTIIGPEKVSVYAKFQDSDTINSSKYGIDETYIRIVKYTRIPISLSIRGRGTGSLTEVDEGSDNRMWLQMRVNGTPSVPHRVPLSYRGSATYRNSSSSVRDPLEDFTTVEPILWLARFSSTSTIEFNLNDDDLAEGPEEFSVRAIFGSYYFISNTIRILDNDVAPDTVSLSVDLDKDTEGNQDTIGEGDATVEVKVTASLPTGSNDFGSNTTITVMVEGKGTIGKAEAADFTTVDNFDVMIPAGQKTGSGTFNLTITDDKVVDVTPETITVSGSTTRSGLSVTGDTITINSDNDVVSAIALSVDTDTATTNKETTINEDSDENKIEITASLGEFSFEGSSTTVGVTIASGTATIKSTDNSEYDFAVDSSSLNITIPAGTSSGSTTFDIVTNNDRKLETVTSGSGETILISGTPSANPGFSVTGATIEIIDNEVADLLPGRCNGTYVTNTALSDLVKDCKILIGLRNAWSPNLSDSHPLRTWGNGDNTAITSWSGVTISNNRVGGLALAGSSTNGFIEGTIPINLWKISKLTSIDFSNNNLSGEIPVPITKLRGLTALNLSNNSLTGEIPVRFRILSNLRTLDLSSNMLTGSIPSHLGALTNLTSLKISNNLLSGSIPNRIASLVKTSDQGLKTFFFCGNNLEGALDVKFQRIETDIRESDYGNIRACRSSIDLSVDTNGDATGSPIHVGEGGGTVTVTVIATWHTYDNTSLTENVVVTITVAGDSATSPGDFTVDKTKFNLTMEKDQTNKTATFRIILVDDNSVEGTEKVSISGEADGYAVNDTELEVTDND